MQTGEAIQTLPDKLWTCTAVLLIVQYPLELYNELSLYTLLIQILPQSHNHLLMKKTSFTCSWCSPHQSTITSTAAVIAISASLPIPRAPKCATTKHSYKVTDLDEFCNDFWCFIVEDSHVRAIFSESS